MTYLQRTQRLCRYNEKEAIQNLLVAQCSMNELLVEQHSRSTSWSASINWFCRDLFTDSLKVILRRIRSTYNFD